MKTRSFHAKSNQYMSIRTCMFYSYVNGLILLHYTNHILSIYFVIGTCRIWTNSTSPLWRSLEGTTSSGFKMWSSTSLQRICILPLKKQQTSLLAKLKKPPLWSSSEDIFMMPCKLSILLRKIHVHYGSLWLIVLITKRTYSCLKQYTTSSICASKTLSLWMNIILKFAVSDQFSSFAMKLWLKRISWRIPIRPSLLLILSCSNNIELRSSLSPQIWSLFYFLVKSKTSCWWRIIKLDLLGPLLCLNHIIAQINAQNAKRGVVGAAISHPTKVTESRLVQGRKKAQKRSNLAPKAPNFKNKGKTPKTMDADMCYRCGSKDHCPVFAELLRRLLMW